MAGSTCLNLEAGPAALIDLARPAACIQSKPIRPVPNTERELKLSLFGIIRFRDQIVCRRFLTPAAMEKSLNSPEYARLIELLVALRHAARVSQQVLAEKLGRHQSFIAKYEGGERRIDVVEFVAIARALNADPLKLFREFLAGKPAKSAKKRVGSKVGRS
jgi:DNA-binding transcriptional regulator YiaG